MKVKQIMEMLSRYSPEDELVVLWWDKPQFDNLDGLDLSHESWDRICKEFDEWEDAGSEVNQWILDASIDYAELVKEEGITKSEYASKMGLAEEAVDNWEDPDA